MAITLTLKAARVNKGYTQAEAAKLLKVSKATIGNWERGKSFPNMKDIKEIEKVYGVSYDELIFYTCNTL